MIRISPDLWIVARVGPLALSATLLFTWLVMAVLVLGSLALTRHLSDGAAPSRRQSALEVLVSGMNDQVRAVSGQEPGRYLPFVGTLFLFVATSNLLAVVPGYQAPTGSLSTTVALALCVLVAVPAYGIAREGPVRYLQRYLRPTPLMLPFNVIGELSRTLALAVRLYGNIMSGTVLAAILVSLAPFFVPVVMQLLGLLTGMVQAYIFAILAMVYVASAERAGARRGSVTPTAREG